MVRGSKSFLYYNLHESVFKQRPAFGVLKSLLNKILDHVTCHELKSYTKIAVQPPLSVKERQKEKLPIYENKKRHEKRQTNFSLK
jgi:hypothetical protein